MRRWHQYTDYKTKRYQHPEITLLPPSRHYPWARVATILISNNIALFLSCTSVESYSVCSSVSGSFSSTFFFFPILRFTRVADHLHCCMVFSRGTDWAIIDVAVLMLVDILAASRLWLFLVRLLCCTAGTYFPSKLSFLC